MSRWWHQRISSHHELFGVQLALYLTALGLLVGATALVLDHSIARLSHVTRSAEARPTVADPAERPVVRYSRVLEDSWNERLRSQRYWSDRRSSAPSGSGWSGSSASKSSLTTAPQPTGLFGLLFGPVTELAPEDSGIRDDLYTTVCVRLCDGSYKPVSFATTRDRFQRDEQTCQASCDAPSRLFVYRNPGGSPEQMADTRGQPYAKLPTAFLYRTTYDAACKCRPHPWDQVSLDRHRVYALEAQTRKGSRMAAGELKAMRAKQAEDARAEAQRRKAEVALAKAQDAAARRESKVRVTTVLGPPTPNAAVNVIRPPASDGATAAGSAAGTPAVAAFGPPPPSAVAPAPAGSQPLTAAHLDEGAEETQSREAAARDTKRRARGSRGNGAGPTVTAVVSPRGSDWRRQAYESVR